MEGRGTERLKPHGLGARDRSRCQTLADPPLADQWHTKQVASLLACASGWFGWGAQGEVAKGEADG